MGISGFVRGLMATGIGSFVLALTIGAGEVAPRSFSDDYGDAPDSYGTTAGAAHRMGYTDFILGQQRDAEASGQPSSGAQGDDVNSEVDDEDGVFFSTFYVGTTENISVQVTSPYETDGVSARGAQNPRLDAFIDFNGNGTFEDAERITPAAGTALTSASYGYYNQITVSVPLSAKAGTTFARFRLSNAGGLGPTGIAPDGEVEDYQVTIAKKPLDYGDAPDSYGTQFASDGARHDSGIRNVQAVTQARRSNASMYLGTMIDTEEDAPVALDGSGDDKTADDDEDGVTFSELKQGAGATATVVVTVDNKGQEVQSRGDGPPSSSKLDAFIDFDGNGVFDANERITAVGGTTVSAGSNNLDFTVPDGAKAGVTYARVRLSSAGGLGPRGLANDGEVEDYQVNIVAKAVLEATGMTATKTAVMLTDADNDGTVSAGDALRYTVTIKNTGPVTANGVIFTDVPDANTTLLVGSVTTQQGTVTKGNSAGDIIATVSVGNMASGAEVKVTLDVTINKPLPSGTTAITNQGSVGGNNFKAVKTDSGAGLGQPTTTNVRLNLGPIIIQGPFATRTPTGTDQTVRFSVTATDTDVGPNNLTYSWDYGDGTTGTGNPSTHQYAVSGTYTVKVTVTDGSETASGSVDVVVGLKFIWRNLWVRLNWKNSGRDQIVLEGHLTLPEDFRPLGEGEPIEINIGDVEIEGLLKFGGWSRFKSPRFEARYKLFPRSNNTRLLRVIINKGQFKDLLNDEGLTNEDIQNAIRDIQVTLTIRGEVLSGPVSRGFDNKKDNKGEFGFRHLPRFAE